jgi:hypothetical protein
LEEVRVTPLAHVAVLLPEDVQLDAHGQHVWFCFVRATSGALSGAVLLFRICLDQYPNRAPSFTAVTPLGPFAAEIDESLRLLLGSYTATTPMSSLLVGLRRAVTDIESDARDGASLARASREMFEKSFGDVFLPSEELAALAGTIERRPASLLRDSQSFLTASQLFLSQSGMDIGLSQSQTGVNE